MAYKHHLSIDLETYSSVSLQKAGLYAYVESPDFEILLLAYSLDDLPVIVIDLAQGGMLPDWLEAAIGDEAHIKHAYNASFEIACLSKYFGSPLDPSQWRCTLFHGLYAGYPAGLEAVGKALGLEDDKKKLATGKALIRYFCLPCAPTKANGGRTRNYPQDAPDKWQQFIEYNRQDVVTEMAVEKKLSRFVVPEWLQKQWAVDLEIHRRGVAVDRDLVAGALAIRDEEAKELMEEAAAITGLDNPNSLQQMTGWLATQNIEVSSLTKDTVAGLLALPVVQGPARRVLEIRQELGKTSTKKYDAIASCTCPDGRIRGLLQFYGAARTGRWCLTGDHEVLTPDGWVRLDEWSGGKIMCWTPTAEMLSFQKSEALQFDYSGQMYVYEGQRVSQIATPEHKMAILDKAGNWEPKEVKDIGMHRFTIPFTGRTATTYSGSCKSDELRVLVMTQADGYYTDDGCLRFHFSKQRKIDRCKKLLRAVEIPFMERRNGDGTHVITIFGRFLPLWLRQFRDKNFGWWLLNENLTVLFDEIPEWDGYRCGPNSIQYTTTNRQNADIIQACALCAGLSATLVRKKRSGNWSDAYHVNVWMAPGHGTSIRKEQVSTIEYTGKVYCASTKTGYFVVRRDGRVWITGNSGRLIQVQNLPRTYTKEIELARDLVKAADHDALRVIYGSVHDTLSQLIRTALVASPGRVLVDADFSAIEARVISWVAGEEWRLKAFREGQDIYCASASQMFGVPVEKHGPNGHLRQKGKIAELALGYQGSANAMIAMGALDTGLSEEELPEIVRQWRDANPRIRQLWYDMQAAAEKVIRLETAYAMVGKYIMLSMEYNPDTGINYMVMRLPSSRKLFYPDPQIGTNRFGGSSITYLGVGATKKWERLETYGGKLVENAVQAIARDCLAYNIDKLDAAGYEIVFHVHDEVVIDYAPVPDKDGKAALDDVVSIMSSPIWWAPGLPLDAAGWVGDFFTKD